MVDHTSWQVGRSSRQHIGTQAIKNAREMALLPYPGQGLGWHALAAVPEGKARR